MLTQLKTHRANNSLIKKKGPSWLFTLGVRKTTNTTMFDWETGRLPLNIISTYRMFKVFNV